MNKEEILAKSRMENKDKDITDLEADKKASNFALIFGAIVSLILFIIQIITGNGVNYSLWAFMGIIPAAINFHKYHSLKQKKNLINGIIWTITSILVLTMTINSFIN
ncbi:MAG: hypothetical protein IJZ72_00430 [Oscillospiraceae bacterium]|nr:hypothetical protein [Oscillospiraceae bacterium]